MTAIDGPSCNLNDFDRMNSRVVYYFVMYYIQFDGPVKSHPIGYNWTFPFIPFKSKT